MRTVTRPDVLTGTAVALFPLGGSLAGRRRLEPRALAAAAVRLREAA